MREITRIAVVGRGLDTVGSVAFGGFAALIIVAMWAMLFPDLRRVERPDEKVAGA